MGERVGLIFLLVLGISWAYAAGTSSEISDVTVTKLNNKAFGSESEISEENTRNERLCTLCEEFTAQAVDYLCENKTQTEIVEALHQTCSRLHSFKEQCVMLVDYYAPLFFVEIALMRPEEFCAKVNLCEEMTFPRLMHNDTCTICHRAVVDVLTKLKDPETQLEIIETLLKACNKVEHFVQECKKLIFEYGPLILVNAEKFLETTDICATVHVCKASKEKSVSQAFLTELPLHDASTATM